MVAKLASLTDADVQLVAIVPAAMPQQASAGSASSAVRPSAGPVVSASPESPTGQHQAGEMKVDEGNVQDAWHAAVAKLNKEPKLPGELVAKFKEQGPKLGKSLRALVPRYMQRG